MVTADVAKQKRKYIGKRKRLEQRRAALRSDRSSWDPHWKELSEQIEPRRSRFFSTERNKGNKRNEKIINNKPCRAKATLAAGMQAGLTNQSRPWFRLIAPTPELAEVPAVKEYLHTVEVRLREVMGRSNIYNGFHTVYGDGGTFATALMYIEEDVEDVIRSWVFPIGSYCLVSDAKGRVSGVFRETTMTTEQLVDEFGYEKCSSTVQEAYDAARLDTPVEVVHVVERNPDYQEGRIGPAGKKWASCWYEKNASLEDELVLREAGYDEFPFMAPRWMVTGEDTYGTANPGMEALGDCKALQLYEKRNAQAFDKVVNPPMKGPSSLNGQRISLLPGDVTYTDSVSPSSSFSPAHEVQPQALSAFKEKINEIERHIDEAFYADLWLSLTRQEGTMTAREVGERSDEKMLQLGPVVERFKDELHDPCIDRIFGICERRGIFPEPPVELQGFDVKVEYISQMAVAQKLIGIMAIERLITFVLQLAGMVPDALDTLDFDQAVQEHANSLGVPPALVRTDEAIAAIRNAKAKAKAAQAQQQQMQAAAGTAQQLAQTPMDGDTALNRLLAGAGAPGVRS